MQRDFELQKEINLKLDIPKNTQKEYASLDDRFNKINPKRQKKRHSRNPKVERIINKGSPNAQAS